MRRREFIAVVGGVAALPFAARAEPVGKPIIGFLRANSRSPSDLLITAFVQRLRELGWTEDRNVAIEFRWSEGSKDRLPEMVAEFVRLKVDVMVLEGSAATLAAKRATSDIPIVFPVSGDPVGAGLVASLSRPGGNVTGLSLQLTDTANKRLELFTKVVPSLHRLAIMADLNASAVAREVSEAAQATRRLGVTVTTIEIQRAEDIAPAFEALKGHVEALYICSGPLFDTHRTRINEMALSAKLPTCYEIQQSVAAGGLMSYGTNFPDLFRRAAEIVDKILRGAKPADIPVEQPTKFDLVINLKTAKALGLEISPTLLAVADELIE
jgi:putative tryptophan/tyrosine transport system substrate-binding protein